jgi:hypothetical protein
MIAFWELHSLFRSLLRYFDESAVVEAKVITANNCEIIELRGDE